MFDFMCSECDCGGFGHSRMPKLTPDRRIDRLRAWVLSRGPAAKANRALYVASSPQTKSLLPATSSSVGSGLQFEYLNRDRRVLTMSDYVHALADDCEDTDCQGATFRKAATALRKGNLKKGGQLPAITWPVHDESGLRLRDMTSPKYWEQWGNIGPAVSALIADEYKLRWGAKAEYADDHRPDAQKAKKAVSTSPRKRKPRQAPKAAAGAASAGTRPEADASFSSSSSSATTSDAVSTPVKPTKAPAARRKRAKATDPNVS